MACGSLLGCVEPARHAATVPAANPGEESRPLNIVPPVEVVPEAERQLDAIVRIVSDVSCTGTLIADDLVLTAHHCVAARGADGEILSHDKKPSELAIELGGGYLPWGEVKVRAIVAPECGHVTGDGDIAILVLSRRLIGMPTLAVRLEAPPEAGKDSLALHGFGRCAMSGDGVRRVARPSGGISSVGPGSFLAKAGVCPGDSGGPVLSRKGEVIGVISASAMDGNPYTVKPSRFTRVDVWPQLFSAAHEISGGASPSELPPYGDCHAKKR